MFDISKICKKYGRLSAQFTDNKVCTGYKHDSHRGNKGYTNIHDNLKYEFLLWVSDETREMLKTESLENVYEFAKKGAN